MISLCLPVGLLPAGCAAPGAGLNVTEDQRAYCRGETPPSGGSTIYVVQRQPPAAGNAGTIVAAGIAAGLVGVLAVAAIQRARVQECLEEQHAGNERAAGRLPASVAGRPVTGAESVVATQTPPAAADSVVSQPLRPRAANRASPGQFVCPEAGITVRTSSGRTLHFDGADPADALVCLVRRGDDPAQLRLLATIYAAGAMQASDYRALLARFLPYEPGKRVEGTVLSPSGFGQWRFTLAWLGEAELDLPAGRFATFVAEERQQGFAGNSFDGRRRWYFDRESWVPVKVELEVTAGTGWSERPWEARSITETPRQTALHAAP